MLFWWICGGEGVLPVLLLRHLGSSPLPMNIKDWFPLGLTGLIYLQSKGLSRVFSSTTVWNHQFFGTRPTLWSNSTSIHDYWKNHSFDQMDLCWQSNVSACYTVSRLVIAFLPRSKHLLISWLQSWSTVILEPTWLIYNFVFSFDFTLVCN